MLRISGDTIELMPPLIISENQIDEIMEKVGGVDQGGGVRRRVARKIGAGRGRWPQSRSGAAHCGAAPDLDDNLGMRPHSQSTGPPV